MACALNDLPLIYVCKIPFEHRRELDWSVLVKGRCSVDSIEAIITELNEIIRDDFSSRNVETKTSGALIRLQLFIFIPETLPTISNGDI